MTRHIVNKFGLFGSSRGKYFPCVLFTRFPNHLPLLISNWNQLKTFYYFILTRDFSRLTVFGNNRKLPMIEFKSTSGNGFSAWGVNFYVIIIIETKGVHPSFPCFFTSSGLFSVRSIYAEPPSSSSHPLLARVLSLRANERMELEVTQTRWRAFDDPACKTSNWLFINWERISLLRSSGATLGRHLQI